MSAISESDFAAIRLVRGGARNQWVRFFVRRVTRALVSMFAIVTAAFFVLRLAHGDPVRAALGPTAPESVVHAREVQLGLTEAIPVQYWHYLVGLLHGNLGISLVTGRSVTTLVKTNLPPTLELVGFAFAVVFLCSVGLGLWVAVLTQGHRHRRLEMIFTAVTGLFASIPEYLLALMLVVFLALKAKLFPVAGQGGPISYVLPVAALSFTSVAALSRIARVEALNALREDYIRTAYSKRMSPLRVYLRHTLPNMLTATLTLGGTMLATMVASSVLVEEVFNWPGIGTAFVQAIQSQDYGIVQGLALVYAAMVLTINLVVDLVLAMLDRRTTLLENG